MSVHDPLAYLGDRTRHDPRAGEAHDKRGVNQRTEPRSGVGGESSGDERQRQIGDDAQTERDNAHLEVER